eukprot:2779351-Amphidinium_carterae.1
MGGCCARRMSRSEFGLVPMTLSTTCFSASTLSGSTAIVECSDAATVAQLHMMIREQLPISDESFITLVAGSQLLEPAMATVKDLKAKFGNWADGVPVELTVIVTESRVMQVNRHLYRERRKSFLHTPMFHHISTDDVLLIPSKSLDEQRGVVFGGELRTYGYRRRGNGPKAATMAADQEPPGTWSHKETQFIDMETIAQDIFGSGNEALVVYVMKDDEACYPGELFEPPSYYA